MPAQEQHPARGSLPLNTLAHLQGPQGRDPRVKDAKHSYPLNSLFHGLS